jgi:hypothetical protein
MSWYLSDLECLYHRFASDGVQPMDESNRTLASHASTCPEYTHYRLFLCISTSNVTIPLHPDDHSLTSHSIKYASVIHRYVLLRNNLDDLLRHDTTRQSGNVMQLSTACAHKLLHKLANLRLDSCILVLVDGSAGLPDQVVGDLESYAGHLFCVCVYVRVGFAGDFGGAT